MPITPVRRCFTVGTGAAFIAHQVLADRGGRAFQFFERDGQAWLVVAVIDGETTLFRWTGKLFEAHQRLGGPGGREFELFETARGLHLVRICFIEGAPTQPKTDLKSQVYRWDDGQFTLVQEFATFGGTDAATFRADGELFLAVSNSLTADVRGSARIRPSIGSPRLRSATGEASW